MLRRNATLLRCFAGLFVICLATAVVAPSFTVHLRNNLALAGTTLGLMLGFKGLAEKALGVAGGFVSDYVGRPAVIVVGLAVEAVGFYVLSAASSWPQVVVAIIILGVGGIYGPALSAMVMDLAGDERRDQVAAWYQTVANVAFSVGPMLLGVFKSNASVFRFAALMALLGAVVLLGLPRGTAPGRRTLGGMGELLKTPGLIRILWFNASFWVIYAVFNGVMALETERLLGSTGRFVFYTVNAVCVIVFTVVLTNLARRKFSTWGILALGMGFFSAGLLGVIFSSTMPALVITSVVFTIGEILVSSPMQSLTAGLSSKYRGALMGLNAAAGATGGFAGNFSSASLYEASLGKIVTIQGTQLFWAGWAAIPLVVAATVCRGGHRTIPAVGTDTAPEPAGNGDYARSEVPLHSQTTSIPVWTPPASLGQWDLPTRGDYRPAQWQLSNRRGQMMLPRGWSHGRAGYGFGQLASAPTARPAPGGPGPAGPNPERLGPATPPEPPLSPGSISSTSPAVLKLRKGRCMGGLVVRWKGERYRIVLVPFPLGLGIRQWSARRLGKRTRCPRVFFRRRNGSWRIATVTLP